MTPNWKWWWALGAVVLAASGASANTDADENWGGRIEMGRTVGAGMKLVFAGLVCSNAAAADTTCNVFDLGHAKSIGQGDLVVFHLFTDGFGVTCAVSGGENKCTTQTGGANSCAGTATVTLSTSPIRTAASEVPITGSTRDVATTTAVTTASSVTRWLALNTHYTPLDRYLFTALSGMTACDDLDLAIEIYRREDSR